MLGALGAWLFGSRAKTSSSKMNGVEMYGPEPLQNVTDPNFNGTYTPRVPYTPQQALRLQQATDYNYALYIQMLTSGTGWKNHAALSLPPIVDPVVDELWKAYPEPLPAMSIFDNNAIGIASATARSAYPYP